MGLRNDWDQLLDLEPEFDWALSEECLSKGTCKARRVYGGVFYFVFFGGFISP